MGRYGAFPEPSANGRCLRIPAEDRSRRLRIRDRNGFKATLGHGDASWFFLKNVRPNTARSRPHRQPQRRMQRNRRVGPTTARPLGRATGAPDRPKRGTVRSNPAVAEVGVPKTVRSGDVPDPTGACRAVGAIRAPGCGPPVRLQSTRALDLSVRCAACSTMRTGTA
jgi:hypothetical protein